MKLGYKIPVHVWNIIISKQKAITIFEEKFIFFPENGAEMQWKDFYKECPRKMKNMIWY